MISRNKQQNNIDKLEQISSNDLAGNGSYFSQCTLVCSNNKPEVREVFQLF